MDCDGTHDPIYLKKILKFSKDSDLVITNRFKGKINAWLGIKASSKQE